ncbi:hypothetical protein BGW38_000028 [Lunasporangiospora selenospora]|uniref:Peptidase inhibitor I9 n=1 Tax=Lunasporangiospora selenospora TaxID=979761 RepID=A0A9P6G3W1_9FUNG|nr:hypothetical protein BGW38_000028 [Lunasporangiospora selenospora]
MKCLSLLVVACLAWSSASTTDAATFINNGAGTAAVPGSFIVVLKDSKSVKSFEPKWNQMLNRHNSRNGRRPRINHKFKAMPGFTVTGSNATLTELLNMDEVEYIEQDAIASIQATQGNPPSWGLPRVSRRGALNGGAAAYNFPDSAGSGVTAYVIDTGINTGHVDFGGRATMGANFIRGSPNTDQNGHGTHVAGTIGGNTYGVAKKVRLVGVKVLDAQGQGAFSGIIAGMDWVAQRARGTRAVVNMSLGGGASRAVNDAVSRMVNAGIPVIVAAGNDPNVNACNGSPSGASAALTVGASDIRDNVASFSSYGNCVKIFGPGVQITSAWIGGSNSRNTISGTSMATPHVAGVAALYMGANPNLRSPQQVYSALTSNAVRNVIRGNTRGAANLMVNNGANN